jgi:hypothetical protein
MKKRNKAYKPKPINVHAVSDAVMMVKPLDETAKKVFINDVYGAINAMSRGEAKKAHFDTLARMVDVSLMLLQNIFSNEDGYAVVNEAWEGMIRARERFVKTQRIAFDGEAYNAIKEAAKLFNEIINNITGYEYVKFNQERDRQIALGNYYKAKEMAA